MVPIKFHGVFVDLDAVIGISAVLLEGKAWEMDVKYFFEIHFNGTKMRVNVDDIIPGNGQTFSQANAAEKMMEKAEKMRNELFQLIINRGSRAG